MNTLAMQRLIASHRILARVSYEQFRVLGTQYSNHNRKNATAQTVQYQRTTASADSTKEAVRYVHADSHKTVSNKAVLFPSDEDGSGHASGAESSSPQKLAALDDMPGPGGLKRLPYLGTLMLFWPFSKYTPNRYGALVMALHDKYGPVFKARIGKDYAVHTTCVEDAERVFDSDGQYPQRRLMMLARMYRQRNGLPLSLGAVNGPEWHVLRKPLNFLLNRPHAVLHYLPAQNKVAEDFVAQLKAGNKDIPAKEMYELFFKFSAESIGVVCFNERMGFMTDNLSIDPEKQRLLEAFQTSLNCTYKAIIGLERRFLKTDKDPFYQKYANAMDLIRKESTFYVQKVMDNLKRNSESGATQSDAVKDNLLANLVQREDLNMDQIVAIIESLLIAGSDSTARNLSILLYTLAHHPEVQSRAAEEVRSLIGNDGPVTAQSLGKMTYLKACVKESMRLNYPVATGPERILSQDTVISGYLVPKGTSVVITTNKTSLDPSIFPDPLEYKPERWIRTTPSSGKDDPNQVKMSDSVLDDEEMMMAATCPHKEEGEKQQSLRELNPRLYSFAFIPFGHGPRSCIGRRFAELELYVCAARLLQKLEISVDPSYKELKTVYTPFITPVDPIPFRFSERK